MPGKVKRSFCLLDALLRRFDFICGGLNIKVIGIAGGSGSGKTTLANELMSQLEPSTPILSLDDYYKPLQEQFIDTNGYHNFDLPTSLNLDQFEKDLILLKGASNRLEIVKYDINNPDAEQELVKIEPKNFLITEGIFLFERPEITALIDVLIFVETDIDIMFKRRLKRDVEERNIESELIRYQWINHFVPAYEQCILPKKTQADLIVSGNSSFDVGQIINNLA
jgi:uridine kinase